MARIWTHSLHPRQAVVLLALAVGSLFVALFSYGIYRTYVVRIQEASATTQNLARMLEAHALQNLQRVERYVARTADEVLAVGDLSRADLSALRARLREQLPVDGSIREFSVIDRDGVSVVATLTGSVSGLPAAAERDYFVAHRERAGLGMVIGAPVKGHVDGKWMLPVSYRLAAPGGAFRGVLLAAVDPAYFNTFYDSIDTGANGFATLFDRQGWIVARSPFDEAVVSRNWAGSPMFRLHLPVSEANTVRQVVAADGVERIYSYRALKEFPLIATVGLSLTDILAPWRVRSWILAIFVLAVLATLGGAAWALNGQLERREAAQTALRESETRFRLVADSAPVLIWMSGLDKLCTYFNKSWLEFTGRALEQELGNGWAEGVHPDDLQRCLEIYETSFDARRPFSMDYRLRRSDGEFRSVSDNGVPRFDSAGAFIGYVGSCVDITERKRAEDDLRRFRLAMDNSADMIVLVDRATMRFVDANSTVCRLLGYTRDELLAMRPEELLPVSREELEAAYDRQIADPSVPGGMTSYYRCRDGSRLPFESKRQVLRSGDKVLISVVSRDIRERIQAENTLRESEQRFRSLTELSSDWYWEQDEQLRLSLHSTGFAQSSGTTSDKLLGKRRWEEPGRSPLSCTWDEHRATLEARKPFQDFEYVRIGDDGERTFVSLSGMPIFDAAGDFKGYRGVGKNITERKQGEALLEGQKQALEMIVKGTPLEEILAALIRVLEAQSPGMLCSVLLLDPDGVLLRHGAAPSLPEDYTRAIDGVAIGASTGSCGTAAFRREPVIVEDIASDPLWADYRDLALPHGLRACWSAPIFDALSRVLGTFAMYFRQPGRPTARHRWLIDIATQIAAIAITHRQDEERLAALNAVLETRIASRTAELAKALEAVTEADRMKSDFLANMSHELRTPLHAVIGFADALLAGLHGPLPEAVRGDLGEILASGDNMLAIVNNLLDLARIAAGRFELRRGEIDLAMLLDQAVAARRREAEAKGVALDCACPRELRLDCDAGRVRQALDKLFSNAIKYSPAGGRVRCNAHAVPRAEVRGALPEGAPAAETYLEIAIADSGPGIAAGDQAKLFQPFVQIDRTLSRSHGGSGLGLALVKKLAELHGGAAGVDSAPGRGSTFFVWLPMPAG